MNWRDYSLVTASYWGFTLTDGALRMLVLLHFHELGFTPVQLSVLFLLYEACGVLTNLFGGWIGSRIGLKATLFAGLSIQIAALVMLSALDPGWLLATSVAYVMLSQALSGVAKDLTKMSSKSAIKLLIPAGETGSSSEGLLFKFVAVLTGSKNALKGVGFFLGALLLSTIGFQLTLWGMAGALGLVLLFSLLLLKGDMGKSKNRVKITQLFSKSREINWLSAARFFLFGSRDVWFVVALPIFLHEVLGWNFWQTGTFMAVWVIGYGAVQAIAPKLVGGSKGARDERQGPVAAAIWGSLLALVTLSLAAAVQFEIQTTYVVLGGLAVFGVVFAVNSAVHSYLILAYSDSDKVALNVGFYYMANALGRLLGTLLSGIVYIQSGLAGCLWTSGVFVVAAVILTLFLLRHEKAPAAEPTGASI